ncbi:MAG: hypothetical protein HY040_08325 [Planctomycetes bacterium]|nr:hypothetical protein [Planctomycetota bacterium]
MSGTSETLFTSLAYHWFLSTNPEAPREEAWEFAHEQWQEHQTGLQMRDQRGPFNAARARPKILKRRQIAALQIEEVS